MNENIEFSKPAKLDKKTVCYWAIKEGILYGNQATKAKKFIELDLVKKINENTWQVSPIKGYNKTTYTINENEEYSCNCQFNKKNGLLCSHIMAVKTLKFKEKWNNLN